MDAALHSSALNIWINSVKLYSLSTVGALNPPSNSSANSHRPLRPLKDILETGTADELANALRDLPNGRCDLRDISLTEPMVEMLVSVVQQVEVDTLLLGDMMFPDRLLKVIAHSKVREWNFLSAWAMVNKDRSMVFPSSGHTRYLVEQVLPHLHCGSCTKRIVLNKLRLDANERTSLAPFCIDDSGPSQSLPYGAIRSVVLTMPIDMHPPATTASTTTVAQTDSTQQPQSLSNPSDCKDALLAGNEAVRSLLTASNGVFDMGPNGGVSEGVCTNTLLEVLKNVPIDLLKLAFVAASDEILGALVESQTKHANLTSFNDGSMSHFLHPKWTENHFHHLMAFLNSVSAEQPIKELSLDSSTLTTEQSNQLKREFAWTETMLGPVTQVTFTKKWAPPQHIERTASKPTSDPSSQTRAVHGSHPPSKASEAVDTYTFNRAFALLTKWIYSGHVGGVKQVLSPNGQRLTFTDDQRSTLQTFATEALTNEDEAVKKAANTALELL